MAKRNSLIREFIAFIKDHKAYWLAPIIIVLLMVGVLILVGGSKAAPFIYTLF